MPAAVCPAFAPPLTFSTTVTAAAVPLELFDDLGNQPALALVAEGDADVGDQPAGKGDAVLEPIRSGKPGKAISTSIRSGGDFDDVVRRRFLLAGRADADVAGAGAQLREVGRPEVAHAALHAADEIGQDVVDRAAHLLEGFDAFGGHLAGLSSCLSWP